MDENEFREILERLNGELDQTEPSDDRARELLQILREDIESLMEPPAEEMKEQYESIAKRLEDVIEHFEISHPTLTTMISKLADALNAAQL